MKHYVLMQNDTPIFVGHLAETVRAHAVKICEERLAATPAKIFKKTRISAPKAGNQVRLFIRYAGKNMEPGEHCLLTYRIVRVKLWG